MTTLEAAAVVEATATAIGLFVVIAGAVFAGVQLRRDAETRRLQAMMAVLADVRPPEVFSAQRVVGSLPDGFAWDSISDEERHAVEVVTISYGRLGNLVEVGLVRERDIFPQLMLSQGVIQFWEKVKHVLRSDVFWGAGLLPLGLPVELLAARAEAWLAQHGVERFGRIKPYDADTGILHQVVSDVVAARAAAS